MKPFSQSQFTNGTNDFNLTSFSPSRFSTPAIQPAKSYKPTMGTAVEATPINAKGVTTTVAQSVFSPLNESENTPPLQTIVEERNISIKELNPSQNCTNEKAVSKSNSDCNYSTNKKMQDPVRRISSMLKRLPSSSGAYGGVNALQSKNMAFIQCSVSTQTDCVTVDCSISNDNIRFTQPDYVRPVIEECFEELEDKIKPTFYHFCSQVLTLLHEQSDKIELINRQSILVEKLLQENKELKKRLDRLETMRFGC